MANWKLKCCPRCGGDVFMDTDEGDWFAHCLQCGYTGDKKPINLSELTAAVGRPLRTGRHSRSLKSAAAR
jgi:ribosomal protein S27AE